MKRFWQILAMLMLALMVPASACCYGPDVSSTQGCCSCENHEPQDGDEDHGPAECPSDTIARSQVPASVTLPKMQMVELAGLIQAMIRLQDEPATALESSGLPMTTAPPEMRTTWHFAHRAALLARAPSNLA